MVENVGGVGVRLLVCVCIHVIRIATPQKPIKRPQWSRVVPVVELVDVVKIETDDDIVRTYHLKCEDFELLSWLVILLFEQV